MADSSSKARGLFGVEHDEHRQDLNHIAALIATLARKSCADCVDAIQQYLEFAGVEAARLDPANYTSEGTYMLDDYSSDTLEKVRDVLLSFTDDPSPMGASHVQLATLLNELRTITEGSAGDEEEADADQPEKVEGNDDA